MSIGNYRFRLGALACASLSDGSWDYPLKNLFANVPLEQIQEALRRRNLPLNLLERCGEGIWKDQEGAWKR